MNSECRKYLQNHIKVKLEREPDLTLEDMKLWLLDDKIFDLSQIKTTTFHMFVKRSMDKFRNTGSMARKKGSGGSNSISRQAATRIKRLALNRKRRSTRKVAAMVGVSQSTVKNYLKKCGARAYHRRKVQAMSEEQKVKRVQFARWALEEYGQVVNGNTTWGRLINTDFSAMVKKNGNLNTKNDII